MAPPGPPPPALRIYNALVYRTACLPPPPPSPSSPSSSTRVFTCIYIYFVFFSLPRLLNTLCLFLFPRVRYILINCARPPSISLMMTANERNSPLPSPPVCTPPLHIHPLLTGTHARADTHTHTHLDVDHAQLISYSARELFFTTRSLAPPPLPDGFVLTNRQPLPI